MRNLLILTAALALAGCGGGAPDPVANTDQPAAMNATTGENDANTVEAMSDGTLRLTLARALAKADLACDGVVKAERMPDQKGLPQWRVTCKNTKLYAVTVTPDGTYNIVSRVD